MKCSCINKEYTELEISDIMNSINERGEIKMSMTVHKWGNSLGVRIPQKIARQFDVHRGSKVELEAVDNGILVKPVENKPTLEDLLKLCEPENRHSEVKLGTMGREII